MINAAILIDPVVPTLRKLKHSYIFLILLAEYKIQCFITNLKWQRETYYDHPR